MVFGMSQNGADALAKQGYEHTEIIKHYYIGTEITKIKWIMKKHNILIDMYNTTKIGK